MFTRPISKILTFSSNTVAAGQHVDSQVLRIGDFGPRDYGAVRDARGHFSVHMRCSGAGTYRVDVLTTGFEDAESADYAIPVGWVPEIDGRSPGSDHAALEFPIPKSFIVRVTAIGVTLTISKAAVVGA